MRHLHLTVLAAVAVALCAAPTTAAHPHNDHGHATISPAHGGGLTGDELLGEALARVAQRQQPSVRRHVHDARAQRAASAQRGRRNRHVHGDATLAAVLRASPASARDIGDPVPRRPEREHLACAHRPSAQEFRSRSSTSRSTTATPSTSSGDGSSSSSPLRTIALPADNPFGVPARHPPTASAHGHGVGDPLAAARPPHRHARQSVYPDVLANSVHHDLSSTSFEAATPTTGTTATTRDVRRSPLPVAQRVRTQRALSPDEGSVSTTTARPRLDALAASSRQKRRTARLSRGRRGPGVKGRGDG